MAKIRKQIKYEPSDGKVYIRYGPNDPWIEGTMADRIQYQNSIFGMAGLSSLGESLTDDLLNRFCDVESEAKVRL